MYIEHLNSKQHLINTGQSGEVKRATLEDVRNRIDMLIQRKREREEEEIKLAETDITERIKKTEEEDAKSGLPDTGLDSEDTDSDIDAWPLLHLEIPSGLINMT